MDWSDAWWSCKISLSDRGVGFGFGERMKDSLMLMVYTSGKNSSGMAGLLGAVVESMAS
jgi:hypothetical protein